MPIRSKHCEQSNHQGQHGEPDPPTHGQYAGLKGILKGIEAFPAGNFAVLKFTKLL